MLKAALVLLLAAGVGASNTTSNTTSYQGGVDETQAGAMAGVVDPEFLNNLWAQVDSDGSDGLSKAEFDRAMLNLGIDESIFYNHGYSSEQLFNYLDADNSGEEKR